MTIHEVVHFADGSFRVPTLPPTLKQLLRHAEMYGTEGVAEAAEQGGLARADLVRLRAELDSIESGRTSRHGVTIGKRPRRSRSEKSEAAVMLRAEGLTTAEIAAKIGCKPEHVQRLLRDYERQSTRAA